MKNKNITEQEKKEIKLFINSDECLGETEHILRIMLKDKNNRTFFEKVELFLTPEI